MKKILTHDGNTHGFDRGSVSCERIGELMENKEFNLLQEPWIRVMREDCRVEELSLADALLHAHEYERLAGELPTQDAAILRVLLAVLHAVFERVDADGNEAEIEDVDDALDRWKTLWDSGHFPEVPLRTYFDAQKENFWLFHPTRPFFQIPAAKSGTEYKASKLNGCISESDNKIRLFSERLEDEKNQLSFSEAARWLLNVNAYDDSSVKPSKAGKAVANGKMPSSGTGWLGKIGFVSVCGKTLFETLMLNFVLLDNNEEPWESCIPCWELETPRSTERTQIPVPHDQAALLTLQSRRLLLHKEGDKVTGYSSLEGDFFEKENVFSEQMTVWSAIRDKDKIVGYQPRRHDKTRQMWRDLAAYIPSERDVPRPGIIRWDTLLREEKILPSDRIISLSIAAVQYGDKDSFVTDIFADFLSLHLNLLSEVGKVYRRNIEEIITRCDEIAENIARLASDLYLASGGAKEKRSEPWNTAMEEYYFDIDILFRRWLAGLDADDSESIREEKLNAWRRQSFRIAWEMAEEMVGRAGRTAYIGRTIAIGEGDDRKIFQHFSTPMAMLRFENKMAKFGVMKKIDIIGGNDLENAKKLEKFVACKLQEFLNNPSDRAVRASLAQLRHGIGHWPGEIPTLWGEYLLELPEELMGDGEPSSAEWAIYIALTMFALHQLGKDIRTDPMHIRGDKNRSNSLGDAAQELLESESDRERIGRRFNLVACAKNMEELSYHLRGLVTLLHAKDIPMDYVRLASDLYFFQNPETVNRVRLRWGEDFCRNCKKNENIEEKGQ